MDTSALAKFPCVISDNVYEQFKAHDNGEYGALILLIQESPLRFATELFIHGYFGQYGDGRAAGDRRMHHGGGYGYGNGEGEGCSYGKYIGGDGGSPYHDCNTNGNFYRDCPREWMTEADLLLLREEARIGAEIRARSERRWALYQNVRDAIGFALCIIAAILMFVVIIIVATMPSRNTSPYIVGGSALHEMQNKSK
jgi:hypothetical protein